MIVFKLIRHADGFALNWPKYSRGAFADEVCEAARSRRGLWKSLEPSLPTEAHHVCPWFFGGGDAKQTLPLRPAAKSGRRRRPSKTPRDQSLIGSPKKPDHHSRPRSMEYGASPALSRQTIAPEKPGIPQILVPTISSPQGPCPGNREPSGFFTVSGPAEAAPWGDVGKAHANQDSIEAAMVAVR